jgi:hypothetical protein
MNSYSVSRSFVQDSRYPVEQRRPEPCPSLFIPRVFPNITEQRIRHIFAELNVAEIARVDFVAKTSNRGEKYNQVFVHFNFWYRNHTGQRALDKILRGDEITIVYDEPWFWKVRMYQPPQLVNPSSREYRQTTPRIRIEDCPVDEFGRDYRRPQQVEQVEQVEPVHQYQQRPHYTHQSQQVHQVHQYQRRLQQVEQAPRRVHKNTDFVPRSLRYPEQRRKQPQSPRTPVGNVPSPRTPEGPPPEQFVEQEEIVQEEDQEEEEQDQNQEEDQEEDQEEEHKPYYNDRDPDAASKPEKFEYTDLPEVPPIVRRIKKKSGL